MSWPLRLDTILKTPVGKPVPKIRMGSYQKFQDPVITPGKMPIRIARAIGIGNLD